MGHSNIQGQCSKGRRRVQSACVKHMGKAVGRIMEDVFASADALLVLLFESLVPFLRWLVARGRLSIISHKLKAGEGFW